MKRNLGTSFLLTAGILGFTLASGAAAQIAPAAPDPALAAVFAQVSLPQTDLMPKPSLKCSLTCLPFQNTTPTISGSGSSCTAATNSLRSQLQDIAENDCVNNRNKEGSCSLVFYETTTCTLIGSGTYQITGYATYHCGITTC